MSPHVLLNFLDHTGELRTTRIPMEHYDELLRGAERLKYENKGRGTQREEARREQPRPNPYSTPHSFFQDMFNEYARTAQGSGRTFKTPPPKEPDKDDWSLLCRVAGFSKKDTPYRTPEAEKMVVRRAKRKAHPDQGGSTQSWNSLERLVTSLGIKF